MDRDFDESRQATFLLLHNVLGLLTKLEENVYATKAGISFPQFLVLLTVESSEPPVTQTDIAKATARNLNTVSMITDRMDRLGLVRRVRSDDDRRETHISVTELGHAKLAEAIKVGGTVVEKLGNAFSDEEVRVANDLMGKLKNTIVAELGKGTVSKGQDAQQTARVIHTLKTAGALGKTR